MKGHVTHEVSIGSMENGMNATRYFQRWSTAGVSRFPRAASMEAIWRGLFKIRGPSGSGVRYGSEADSIMEIPCFAFALSKPVAAADSGLRVIGAALPRNRNHLYGCNVCTGVCEKRPSARASGSP